MKNETYFLSSLDSLIFGVTRECTFLKKLHFDSGKECVLAEIKPPVIGQQVGEIEDLKYIILAARHEGDNLFLISEFPCFVFIAKQLNDRVFNCSTVTKGDLQILAWGELYKTGFDADNHVF